MIKNIIFCQIIFIIKFATCISNKIINQAGGLFLQSSSENSNNVLENSLCYLTFDRVIEADNLRSVIYDQDNKVNPEDQYTALLAIENTLFIFCRWSLLNEKKHAPIEKTIECYQSYLLEYKLLFQQKLITLSQYKQQIKHYQQAGFPPELAESICFIESIEDFPYLVTLAEAANKSFLAILQTYNECNIFLTLNPVYHHLKSIQLNDHWEKKVCIDLQNELKKITGNMVKTMATMEITVADFFSDNKINKALHQYQTVVKEINALSKPNLMSFIVLKEALAKVVYK